MAGDVELSPSRPQLSPDTYTRILERLHDGGVSFETFTHVPLFTMADVATALGVAQEAQVKSVVVRGRADDLTIFGVHSWARLDLAAAARALGTSRSSLELAPPSFVESELGVPLGAVGLVAPNPLRVVVASSFRGQPTVCFGAGRNDRTICAPLNALADAFGFLYAPIERS